MKQIEIAFNVNNSYYVKNPKMFLQLKELIEYHYKNAAYASILHNKKNIELLTWINDSVPLLQNQKYKLSTKCYWIMHDIHDFPICLNCNKILNDKNVVCFSYGYTSYCCQRCQLTSKEFKEKRIQTWRKNYNDDSITNPTQVQCIREKQRQTCRKNHGTEYPMQNPEIFHKGQNTKQQKYGDKNYVNPDKAKQTKLIKYGNATYTNVEKSKQTCINKYGVDNYAKTEQWLEKVTNTSLATYGTKSPNQSDIVKQHKIESIKQIYGNQYVNVSQVPEIRQKIQSKLDSANKKRIATQRKNGTFNTSLAEENAYHMLHFLYPHLVRQYKSAEYPFMCDFFDPSTRTYIECNFSWTHGCHWFDDNDLDDIARLEFMKSKKSKYYDNAIETWTVRDVKKRKCAEENNLNYIVFWTEKEVRQYVLDELNKIASKM